jgi:hypothetical protein
MHSKELKYLPVDILQIIYKIYYPWVLRESILLLFVIHIRKILLRKLISHWVIYTIYRSGISSQPSEILNYWLFVNGI